MDKRNTERLQSLVEVFMDACQVWVHYANDETFLNEIQKFQNDLNSLDVENCNEQDIQGIQNVTMKMLEEINRSLKESGYGGLRYKGIKH